MVKDFLGHVEIKSAEICVQADLEMKRKALESVNGAQATQPADLSFRRASSSGSSLCEGIMFALRGHPKSVGRRFVFEPNVGREARAGL